MDRAFLACMQARYAESLALVDATHMEPYAHVLTEPLPQQCLNFFDLSSSLRGWVAMGQGRYPEAGAYLDRPAFLSCPINVYFWLIPQTLCLWALAALGRGDHAAAWDRLRQAAEKADATGRIEAAAHAVAAAACFLATEGEKERARDLFALAARHPVVGRSPLTLDVCAPFLERAGLSLPPGLTEHAQGKAQTRDLWDTFQGLLGVWRDQQEPDAQADS